MITDCWLVWLLDWKTRRGVGENMNEYEFQVSRGAARIARAGGAASSACRPLRASRSVVARMDESAGAEQSRQKIEFVHLSELEGLALVRMSSGWSSDQYDSSNKRSPVRSPVSRTSTRTRTVKCKAPGADGKECDGSPRRPSSPWGVCWWPRTGRTYLQWSRQWLSNEQ